MIYDTCYMHCIAKVENGFCPADALQSYYESNLDVVSALPIPAAIADYRKAKQDLEGFLNSIDSWAVPLTVQTKRVELEKMLDTMAHAQRDIKDYTDHSRKLRTQVQKEKANERKQWRNRKSALCTCLVNKKVPAALAKRSYSYSYSIVFLSICIYIYTYIYIYIYIYICISEFSIWALALALARHSNNQQNDQEANKPTNPQTNKPTKQQRNEKKRTFHECGLIYDYE